MIVLPSNEPFVDCCSIVVLDCFVSTERRLCCCAMPVCKCYWYSALCLSAVMLSTNHRAFGLQLPSSVLPTDPQAFSKQAATAIQLAFQDGFNRQVIKLPLSESMYSERSEGFVADRAIGWQGGPAETYRYLQPLAQSVLQQVSTSLTFSGGLGPKISEQILLDFDGSSLLTAEHPSGAVYDVQAMLQPNTDKYYTKTIRSIEEQFSDTPGKAKRLLLLVNPAWRDQTSWGWLERKNAEFLDRYESTFVVDQFVVRGKRVTLIKAYPNGWSLYQSPMPYEAKNAAFEPKLLGTFSDRPKYNKIDELVQTSQ